MKITDIKVEKYSWPRVRPVTNGKHTYTHAGMSILKIETDENTTGIGLGIGMGWGIQDNGLIDKFKQELIGEDPLDIEFLWNKMWVPKLVGRRGLSTQVISSIDIGLWDLKGKIAGLPLYKMLGGFSNRTPAYIAGGYYSEDKGLKELGDEMLEYVSWGVKAVKMKVGALSLHEDALRVKTVREAIGPDIKLMLDANCAYKYYDAIRFANLVEKYEPYWFEEPVMPDDYEGFRKIAEKTTIPIATGENEYTRYGFRDIIERKAVPILNPDPYIMGGITEFMKVVALSQAYDLDISPHGNQEINIHLTAAISNALMLEYYPQQHDRMWDKKYKHTLLLNDDGTVSPPDCPGHGFEPNYEELAPYRIL